MFVTVIKSFGFWWWVPLWALFFDSFCCIEYCLFMGFGLTLFICCLMCLWNDGLSGFVLFRLFGYFYFWACVFRWFVVLVFDLFECCLSGFAVCFVVYFLKISVLLLFCYCCVCVWWFGGYLLVILFWLFVWVGVLDVVCRGCLFCRFDVLLVCFNLRLLISWGILFVVALFWLTLLGFG